MGVCSTEDCISIHRHLEIYSWAQQDVVIAEQWCGTGGQKLSNACLISAESF
jgi:hypothetical protein